MPKHSSLLEGGINGHEDVVTLVSQRSRGGLGQVGIGLQGFVKHLLGFVTRSNATGMETPLQ